MSKERAVCRLTKLQAKGRCAKIHRYLTGLKRSLRQATKWVGVERNDQKLWMVVRSTVEAILWNEWKSGALVGVKSNQAFFVRCDRTTITQSDLDNGRLICLVGVAVIKPAEFVIFRIGQWTADRKPDKW